MAITFVSSVSNDNSSATSIGISDPASVAENDFYIACCTIDDDTHAGTWSTPSGWTKLTEEHTATSGSGDRNLAVFYRFRGASPVGSTTFTCSGATAATIHGFIAAYRGVDTSTPFDVTYSSGSHYAHAENSATGGTAAAITTASANAAVVLLSSSNGTITAFGAPTNYTLDADHADAFNRGGCAASRIIASAGTETPGAWTHTVGASAETQSVTLALKAQAASLYPDMEPLYLGATLLASKSNIEYAVWLGTAFSTEPDSYGTNGTTDASGNFEWPGAGFAGAVSDPAVVALYWEEGSAPVTDRSIVVKTTLVEPA